LEQQMKKLISILAALCVLALASGAARAQTTVTGTFLASGGVTPSAAGLSVLQQVAGTDVCGEVNVRPYNAATKQAWSILWNGTTYAPQEVVGYIRCSDGNLISASGSLGVPVIPNTDSSPAGTLTWMRGGLTGTSDGTIRPASWSEAKIVPDQSTVDWGSLPVATIVDVGYQTVEQAGSPLATRQMLNFLNGVVCSDNATLTRTDCNAYLSFGTIAITSPATSGAHTFPAGMYSSAPVCTAAPLSNPGAVTWWLSPPTTSGVTVNLSSSATITFSFSCSLAQN
jgi:hypothetical protein